MRSTLILLLPLCSWTACGGNKPPQSAREVAPLRSEPGASNKTRPASPNVSVGEDILKSCNIVVSSPAEAPKFDYDSSELAPEDISILNQVAKCLTTGPLKGRNLELVGRADPRGTEQYNMALGAKRAHQVTDYLEKQGVPPIKVRETSRGSLDATGQDEAGYRQDRRVDLVLGS